MISQRILISMRKVTCLKEMVTILITLVQCLQDYIK